MSLSCLWGLVIHTETQERIERNSKKYLAKVRRQGKTKSAAVDGADVNNTDPDLAAVRKDFATCLEYADEKVGLAMQTYEMVCGIDISRVHRDHDGDRVGERVRDR